MIAIPHDPGVSLHWALLGDSRFSSGPLTEERLHHIYRDVPSSTLAERRSRSIAHAKRIRFGVLAIALWGLIAVVAVEAIGMTSPLLGYIIVGYSIDRAARGSLRMLGYVKITGREKAEQREEQQMKHHHYHCKLNSEGFWRLKTENFQGDIRESTHQEAAAIRNR